MRQQIYLSALRTLPEVELHFGRFLSKNIWRRLTNVPIAGALIHSPVTVTLPAGTYDVTDGSLAKASRLVISAYPAKGSRRGRKTTTALHDALIAEFHAMEEKGSDVNLAAHLLNDSWKGVFDEAVVISNDTDLVEPIRMVTVEQRKKVLVVCPGRHPMAPQLAAVASFRAHLRPSMLLRAQLPDLIPGTTIRKPSGW